MKNMTAAGIVTFMKQEKVFADQEVKKRENAEKIKNENNYQGDHCGR